MNKHDIIENLDMLSAPQPFAWGLLLASLAVISLTAGGVVLLVRGRRSRPGPPPVPPGERALAALEVIRRLAAEGGGREFVFAVSGVLRVYIEEQFFIAAPKLSTEEFLLLARDAERLGPAQRRRLAGFLARCDRVKFGLAEIEHTAREQLLLEAETFVHETHPPQQPEAAAR